MTLHGEPQAGNFGVEVDAAWVCLQPEDRTAGKRPLPRLARTGSAFKKAGSSFHRDPQNHPLDFGLFSHLERVVDLDTEISHGRFDSIARRQ